MIAVAAVAAALLAQVVVTPDADRQRVDLYDTKGNRTGHATVDRKTGRVETFDTNSGRTGYGVIKGNTIELFDNRSNRVGSGRLR